LITNNKKLQKLPFTTAGFTLLIAFGACTKIDKTTVQPPPQCRIATASDNAGHVVNTFIYDNSNRLVTLVHVSDYDPYTKHLSYNGDSLISYIDAGVNSSTDTILLNRFGLIATERQVISLNGTVDNTFYTFNANGILLSSNNGPNSTTVDYTFINGDNIYQTYNSQGTISVDTFSYYTAKLLVPVDFVQYQQYLFHAAYFYKNKHLVKSYQSAPYYGNYSYDFDAYGNIATIYSDFGVSKDTMRFTYICP
jgi:hypothetical protein